MTFENSETIDAPAAAAEQLIRFAQSRRMASTGRKPSWVGG